MRISYLGNLREVFQMFHRERLTEAGVVRAARIRPGGSSNPHMNHLLPVLVSQLYLSGW
jgi:hypothetical protein